MGDCAAAFAQSSVCGCRSVRANWIAPSPSPSSLFPLSGEERWDWELRWRSIEGVGPPPPAQKSMKTYERRALLPRCVRRRRATSWAGEEVWRRGILRVGRSWSVWVGLGWVYDIGEGRGKSEAAYVGCPGCGEGGLEVGSEEIRQPVSLLLERLFLLRCGGVVLMTTHQGKSANSKTSIRGRSGAMAD